MISNRTIMSDNLHGNQMIVHLLEDLESYNSSIVISCTKNHDCVIVCGTCHSGLDPIGRAA